MKTRARTTVLFAIACAASACGAERDRTASEPLAVSCDAATEWTAGAAYGVGALVTFAGQTYQCIQAHTSQPDWTPPAVPALWGVVDCDGGGDDGADDGSDGGADDGSGDDGAGDDGSGDDDGGDGGGGGLPARVLVGYWHNFDNGSGFIKLRDVSPDWDVIDLAFGEPVAGSTSQIAFTPDAHTSVAEIQSDVQILHGRGKKVLLSVGGANGHVELRSDAEQQQFVDSVTAIIDLYGLDGLDVDFEGQSVHVDRGDSDFTSPTTPVIVNLIQALRQIHDRVGPDFVLTMAPETFFVQVGYQFYGGTSNGDTRTGAYLPVIHGVRDILTLLHVQDYNSGPVTALDNRFYSMGNADFHVAMTEMLMTGFPVASTGRTFPGLRPDQIAIGLPANVNAGNGWTPVAEVQRALDYLIRGRSFGGTYVLRNSGGYPAMRGLMSWSINWDRFAGFDFSQHHRAYLDALPAP